MARRLQLALLAAVLVLHTAAAAPTAPTDQENIIQLAVWASLDAYPGLTSVDSVMFSDTVPEDPARAGAPIPEQVQYAKDQIKTLAPFLLEGMIYGWKFDYTPYDKTRGVKEYFSFEPAAHLTPADGKIHYTKAWIENSRLNCWVVFYRTAPMLTYYQHWQSISHPVIGGRGTGPMTKGFDGIHEACEAAVKNAVREYWRTRIKNKPKEITGTVLLRGEPRLFIKDGQYTADLDFFLETGRIVTYNQF